MYIYASLHHYQKIIIMSSYKYEFWLKSVFLLENGESVNLKGNHIISIVLHNPKADAERSVETILKLPLGKDEPKCLLKKGSTYSTEPINFEDKALFKRSLEGWVVMTATIAVSKSPNKLTPVLKEVLKGALVGAAGIISGPGAAIIAGAVTSLTETVLKAKEVKDKVVILGEGTASVFDRMPSGEIHLNLSCPEEIKGPKREIGTENENGEPLAVRTVILEGAPLGHIVLGVERIWTGDGPEPIEASATATSESHA